MQSIQPLLIACMLTSAVLAGESSMPSMSSATVHGEILHANILEIAGVTFRDITTRPEFKAGMLGFEAIEAKAYRGRVIGYYRIELGKNPHIHSCHFELDGLDLAVLARSLGATTDLIAGQVHGWVDMSFSAGDIANISGKGEIRISNGTLVPFPFLTNFLAGNPGAADDQDSLLARFALRNGSLHILGFGLDSPKINIRGNGRIGFDGMLDVQISPRLPFTVISQLPLLGPWVSTGLSKLTDRVTRYSLQGHITQPVLVSHAF